ncbi:poly(A) polymerase [Elusimicrobium posterum]|uniref:HD domain-containing protein n=1 Tax=Elusimicrobium posterum TaxID=3116653 RepID=UPI003C76A832
MKNLSKILYSVIGEGGFYVGGCVRDAALKRLSGDIDIALPKELVKPAAIKLAKELNAAVFEMDAQFGVWRIVTRKENLQIDLTAFQGKDLEEDLKRRDFTVNALAYPLSALPEIKITKKDDKIFSLLQKLNKKKIIDLNKGLFDIIKKTINANDKKVFAEDPLRILRAYRTSAELGYKISPATVKLMRESYPLALAPAGERIHEELTRICNSQAAYATIAQMDKNGFLTTLFPALEEQRECAVVYYGKGGVLKHTLAVVERMDYLLTNLKKVFPKYSAKLKDFTQQKHIYIMAALLHDVAKPATAKEINGRLRFFFHEEKGAAMARVILQNFRYSADDIKLISAMIGEHLRPSNLASNNVITDRGVYKFFRDLGSAGVPMLLLCWADYASYISHATIAKILPETHKKIKTLEECNPSSNVDKTLRHMQVINFMFKKYFETPHKINPPKIIDGKEIMDLLKIKPGKQVGEILNAVAEAQVEGKISTKEEAQEFVKSLRLAI